MGRVWSGILADLRVTRVAALLSWLSGNKCNLTSVAGVAAVLIALQQGAAEHGGDKLIMSAAIALAAFLSSIGGFAFGPICGAMLFRLSPDRVQVVQIIITCSIANQAAMSWSVRQSLQWRPLWITLIGGAAGLPLGIWLLLHADRALYRAGLGIFLITYAGFRLFRKPVTWSRQPVAIDAAAGLLGGVTGGAVGFPSAFVSIWSGMKGWDKTRQRGLCQPFILVMQIAALLLISLGGSAHGTIGFDPADLLFIPGSLLGTTIGLAVYRRLSDLQFSRVVNMLLIISGVSYVI